MPAQPDVQRELPLKHWTDASWGELAAQHLDIFLADHAICEQQAALFGLSLIGHYPEDDDLVEKMSALAAEEVAHLRRVTMLLRKRGHSPSKKRANPWVQGLRRQIESHREDLLKVDRLLVGALIEARSCERFTCLMQALGDREPEVRSLLFDLGPAEKRHWQMFFQLAQRHLPPSELEPRWQRWLELEASLSAAGGTQPTVHG